MLLYDSWSYQIPLEQNNLLKSTYACMAKPGNYARISIEKTGIIFLALSNEYRGVLVMINQIITVFKMPTISSLFMQSGSNKTLTSQPVCGTTIS